MCILDRIEQILEPGDGHFVLAVDANSNWIAFLTMDKDVDDLQKYLGTGDTAKEALDNMLR